MTTIGVLGGGQLARMMALAARPLGIDLVVVESAPDCPAAPVADVIVASYGDPAAWEGLARRCDVVTVELEGVPVEALEWLAERLPTRPGAAAVAIAQDRLREKQAFRALGARTAPFAAEGFDDVGDGPAIVKTRFGGYDGRGQIRCATDAERAAALAKLPNPIVEGFVEFRRELSIVAARGFDGAFAPYPLVENSHRDGILRRTDAPATGVTPALQADAEAIARRFMESVGYVGVCGIELFDTADGLVVNECAPRVHNSGHWTMDGAETGQFEQHVRALTGLPLGSSSPRGVSAMVNLIGEVPPIGALLAVGGTHVHTYGKEARPGRKVGHVNVTASDLDLLAERLAAVETIVARGQGRRQPQ